MNALELAALPSPPSERITVEREEVRYSLPAGALGAFASELSARLPPHRPPNSEASAEHFVTTVYFDTPSRAHLRAVLRRDAQQLKLRAKQYSDFSPWLGRVVRRERWWLELKSRAGSKTTKHRALVGDGQALASALRLGTELAGVAARSSADQAALELIQLHANGLREPLRADSVVNYRRLAWQDHAASLRVTVDVGLAVYAPPSDLWTCECPLLPAALDPLEGAAAAAIVEIKHRSPPPDWLRDALLHFGAEPRTLGKFELAGRVLYG